MNSNAGSTTLTVYTDTTSGEILIAFSRLMDDLRPTIERLMDYIDTAFQVVRDLFHCITYRLRKLFRSLRWVNRVERKPDPMSLAHARAALRHLPRSVIEKSRRL